MRIRTIGMLATVVGLVFLLTVARAEDQPDATIKLHGGSVAVGIGYSWGGGTLTYKGKTYEVEVKGLSVGDVGIRSSTMRHCAAAGLVADLLDGRGRFSKWT